MKMRDLWICVAILVTLVVGCGPNADQPASNAGGTGGGASSTKSEMPKEIRIGVIPAENNEENTRTFEPMRAHLEKKLGLPVKLILATDYSGIIEAMRGKKIEAAWFGPLSYVLAEREAGAEAFAIQVQATGEPTYRSLFVVPGDSPAQKLADLRGKRVAFVDPTSTSGGLVPTLIIKKQFGVLPDKFFAKITYAGGHDLAEMAVKNKSVDAAATDDVTYNKMIKAGKITPQTNRILSKSDPLPGAPVAYRKDLPDDLKAKIKETFTTAHKEMAQVTGDGNTKRFDPATPERYAVIREMVKTLELQQKDLLK